MDSRTAGRLRAKDISGKYQTRAAKRAKIRAVCELMERRLLLTATLDNQIPTTITPSSVAQTLLAPGNNSYSLTTA